MRDTDFPDHEEEARTGQHGEPCQALESIQPATHWRAEEDALVEEHYGRLAVREIHRQFLPHRSMAGICARAERLGVTGPARIPWTAQERTRLQQFYGRVPIAQLIRDHLPRRTASAIHTRAHALGFANKATAGWAPWELQLLAAHYGRMSVRELHLRHLPQRTLAAIITQARLQSLSEPAFAAWTPEEDQILRKHYPSLPVPKIRERHLPHRTRQAVRGRADVLGLRKFPRIGPWTDDQVALLREEFPKPGGVLRLCEHFHCSGNTIRSKARELGLCGPRAKRWPDPELATLRGVFPEMQDADGSPADRIPERVAATHEALMECAE